MTTLVVGARGQIGRCVLDLLLAAGEPVRASTRTPADGQFPTGVEAVRADVTDPESLRAALVGVHRVFLYTPASDPTSLLRVLEEADLEQVVQLSSGSVLLGSAAGNPIAEEHRAVEKAFAETQIQWTPIRPLVLAGNDLNWAPAIRSGGAVPLVRPNAATAPIHERDIAAVAVAALTGTVEPEAAAAMLTGGELLTQRERVAVIGRMLHRPVDVQELTEAEARVRFTRGDNQEEVDAILAFIRGAEAGDSPATDAVERILGRPPLTFAQWARDHRPDFE